MKNNSKIVIAAGLTAVIASIGLAASSFAYQGNSSVKGPNYSPERHEQMEVVFETGDYDAWKELMSGRGRVLEIVNEENFAKFVEAHELTENGDVEGAKEIRAELGLGQGDRHGMRDGKGKGGIRGMNRTGERGQNAHGSFVDANGDGICDKLDQE